MSSLEPHLWFDDLTGGVEWYSSVLGFEIVNWYPDKKSATWCQLKRGDQRLMIAVTPPPAQTVGNQEFLKAVEERLAGEGSPLALYLHVENADEIHDAAIAGGAEIIEPLWDAWWGGRQFTVADPAGTWWTVFEPTDP